MEAPDSQDEWPNTPQKGDIVDKLLKKLLAKHIEADSLGNSTSTAAGSASRGESSYDGHLPRGVPSPRETSGPRATRLAQQLASAREALRSPGVPSEAACRVAALEAKVYQFETDTVAATASKRRVEQELIAAKAQLSAMGKSVALQKADWEQATNFLRNQLETKSEEAARLDHQNKKLASNLTQLREESERQHEDASSAQRRLHERVALLERKIGEVKDGLRDAESRNRSLETANRSLADSKAAAEEEATRLRQHADVSKREASALREELSAAREQIEAALLRATGSREAEQALRDTVAHRAALVQESRGLRAEVGRLQSALLEEKAAREQTKQRLELKLAAAGHEVSALRTKLEAKIDETKATKAMLVAGKADAERIAEAHEAEVAALKERLAEGRRGVEEVRRKAAEELQAAEARWEERKAAAVEKVVGKYQRRIQDLEMQLAHFVSSSASGGFPGVGGTDGVESGNLWGMPGGYAASVLDYIPRSEHLRLLEIRTTARDAEARAEVAAAKATAVAEGRSAVAAVTRELEQTREELQKAVHEGIEHKERAARAEHVAGMLRTKCSEATQQLERAQEERAQLATQVAQLENEIKTQQAHHTKASAEAAEALAAEVRRGDKAYAGLEAAVETAKEAENAAKTVEKRRAELENAVAKGSKQCNALSCELARVQAELAEAEDLATEAQQAAMAAADRARMLQERCSLGEMEQANLRRQIDTLTAELTQGSATITALRDDATRQRQVAVSALLTQLETALGLIGSSDPTSSPETRLEVVLSRFRQQQAEATSSALTAQHAKQEVAAAQARQAAAEQHYMAIQQQYAAEMAALERTAREQVQGVRSEAEEVLAGLRRASTVLQDQVRRSSVSVTRAGSLASEVEDLKIRLAQQVQQAEQVEKKELAFAALLSQLTNQLNRKTTDSGETTQLT